MTGTLLDSGKHADVWLSSDGTSVEKIYRNNDVQVSQWIAEQEQETLATVASILRDVQGVSSPAPFPPNGTPGVIQMEFCSGSPLYEALEHARFSDERRLRDLAHRLALALVTLSSELSNDRLDLSGRRNVLYDDATDELVLLDFTPHRPLLSDSAPVSTLEQVTGSFLAANLTVPLHRSTLLPLRRAQRIVRFAGHFLGEAGRLSDVRLDNVETVAWTYFWHRTCGAGPLRYVWFSSVGRVAFWLMIRRL